jgi:hypothetical protein
MEHVREWVEAHRPRRTDLRRSPPLSGRPLHLEHVVSDDLPGRGCGRGENGISDRDGNDGGQVKVGGK